MRTKHRSYSEVSGDFNLLCHFIIAHNDHVRSHSIWSLGRFVDCKYGMYENKMSLAGFYDKNAQLWFDAFGELVAFARDMIQECVYRLHDMGMHNAYITGYSPEAIVIWDPHATDQNTGNDEWIGSAAGLTPAMGTGQTYTTLSLRRRSGMAIGMCSSTSGDIR